VGAVTGGDEVAAALEALGVEVVFGIPSVHNLPLYDALRRRGRVRVVTVRHEQAAAGAADGYARVTGRLGVAITSTGPGAANAAGALLEARDAGSPVLHLTGQVERRYLGLGKGYIHEVPDQAGMLRAVSKGHALVLEARAVGDAVHTAAEEALRPPRGPVSVELPIDLQYETVEAVPPSAEAGTIARRAGRARDVARAVGDHGAPDPAALAEAASLLRASRRPLVWAGGGVVAAGADAELRALAARLGAGVLTTVNARGVLDEADPSCVGNLAWDPEVRELCLEADVMVAVGTRFRGPDTENWRMGLPRRLVQVDVDAAAIGRNYPVAVGLEGDARVVLTALLGALGPRGDEPDSDPSWRERVAAVRAAARARLRATLGAQEGLLDATEDVIDEDVVVVKDATIPAYTWGNRLLRVRRPRTSVAPSSFAIGLGLPHAVGAAAAVPGRPVLLLAGDGGFVLAASELATAATERLAVVAVVFCDGGYGILRNIEERQFGATIGVELGRPDFVALAGAFGVPGERVASVEEYAKVLRDAMGRAEPFLLEVDLDAVGPMAVPYVGTSRPPRA